jgi:hypothetical protein
VIILNSVIWHLPIFTVLLAAAVLASLTAYNNVFSSIANNKPVTWCNPSVTVQQQHHANLFSVAYYVLRFKVTTLTILHNLEAYAVGRRNVRLPPIWLCHQIWCFIRPARTITSPLPCPHCNMKTDFCKSFRHQKLLLPHCLQHFVLLCWSFEKFRYP